MRLGKLLDGVENSAALDKVVQPLQRAVRAVIPRGRVRDALHGVWLGHPAHPMLVQLPIGAFLSAGVLDAAGAEKSARTLIGVGLGGTVPAIAAGATDWTELQQQQMRVGLVHALGNTAAAGCYLASLVARGRGSTVLGRRLAYGGLAIVGLSGAIGGHLAYRQAAGPNHAESAPHLIEDGWHDIGAAAEFPERRPVGRTVGEVPVVVVRDGAELHVLTARCAHLSGPLEDGEVTDVDGQLCLKCPWHGSVFRLRDGFVEHGPATADQPAFQVRQSGGRVEVCLPVAG